MVRDVNPAVPSFHRNCLKVSSAEMIAPWPGMPDTVPVEAGRWWSTRRACSALGLGWW
jgi:hypothetical protein